MKSNYIELASSGARNLKPYEPGKSTEDLERELGICNAVKLASNENPLGPSQKSIAACQSALASVHLYPDNDSHALKDLLSDKLGVEKQSLVVGNGSTQLIDLIANAYLGDGEEAIYSEYGFIYYAIAVASNNAKAKVTKAKNWGHDLTEMANAITESTKVVFIANPNNPTGTWLSHEEILGFMQKVPSRAIVVLDEAYIEYQVKDNLPNAVELHKQFPNLIVTRTFSKAYGLSGLRIGYAITSNEIADVLNRLRAPFSVNSLSELAAVAVLQDKDYLAQSRLVNQLGLAQLEAGLKLLDIEYIPSAGNFITIKCSHKALRTNLELMKKGLIVRPLTPYNMPDHLRITVGLEAQNKTLLQALERLL